MNIIFEKIKYQNIMSVGQQPIEVQLDSAQQTLMTGKNGNGKSTMVEAIYFALFGKPFRDIKKAQLINSINKKNMLVELWFTADKNQFYIKRGQKPTVFEVHKNGESMPEAASVKDFQAVLEEMIGMNSRSFKQTTILGTAGYVPFMELKTPERRALVEDLLEVSVLGIMDKLNKTYIRELTQNISSLDSNISYLNQQVQTHEDYIKKQKQQASANTERYQVMLDEEQNKGKEKEAEIKQLDVEISNIVLPDQADMTPYINAKSKLEVGIQNYNKVIAMHKQGGNCPTCSQVLKGDTANAEHCITDYQIKLEKVKMKMTQLMRMNEEYRLANEQFRTLKSKRDSVSREAETHYERSKKLQAVIAQTQKEVNIDYKELNELKEQRLAKMNEKSNYVLEKYHRGFITDMLKDTGIKASIIKKYLPYFNSRIKSYLDIMGADYSFTLNESFEETIKSRGRETFSYMSFSQGEKARITFALLMTWRDVASQVSGSGCNLLILDEVGDNGFDTDGMDGIDNILRSMTDKNIYIISHKPQNVDSYNRHIQMVKKGRFTVADIN